MPRRKEVVETPTKITHATCGWCIAKQHDLCSKTPSSNICSCKTCHSSAESHSQ